MLVVTYEAFSYTLILPELFHVDTVHPVAKYDRAIRSQQPGKGHPVDMLLPTLNFLFPNKTNKLWLTATASSGVLLPH